jgi:hypothetical protein
VVRVQGVPQDAGSLCNDVFKQLLELYPASSGHTQAPCISAQPQGKLRIGLAEQTVLVALAQASLLHEENKEQGIKKYDAALAGRLETAAQARLIPKP